MAAILIVGALVVSGLYILLHIVGKQKPGLLPKTENIPLFQESKPAGKKSVKVETEGLSVDDIKGLL